MIILCVEIVYCNKPHVVRTARLIFLQHKHTNVKPSQINNTVVLSLIIIIIIMIIIVMIIIMIMLVIMIRTAIMIIIMIIVII